MQTDSQKLSDPDAPLLALIERPMSEMTDDELRAHVTELQAAAQNVQATKKKLTKKKTAKKKSSSKLDLDSTLEKLL